jgi:hypothetical protein
MTDREGGSGGVLRLRNLAMIEDIRHAEDPAWPEHRPQPEVRRTPRAGEQAVSYLRMFGKRPGL